MLSKLSGKVVDDQRLDTLEHHTTWQTNKKDRLFFYYRTTLFRFAILNIVSNNPYPICWTFDSVNYPVHLQGKKIAWDLAAVASGSGELYYHGLLLIYATATGAKTISFHWTLWSAEIFRMYWGSEQLQRKCLRTFQSSHEGHSSTHPSSWTKEYWSYE